MVSLVSMRTIPLAAAAVLLCGGLTYFVVNAADASVSSDDGAYVLAARAVQDGGWSVPHVVSEVDPEGLVYPFRGSEVTDTGFYPYVRRPAWVLVLAGADAVAGVIGMHVLILMASAAAVIGGGWLGRLVGGPSTGALTALCLLLSPLTYHALQLWSHAVVVACMVFVYVGAASASLQPRCRPPVILGVLAACIGAAVHASALPFTCAVAVVIGMRGLLSRQLLPMVYGGLTGAGSVGVHFVSGRIASSITGGNSQTGSRATNAVSGGRIEGLVDTFVTHPYSNHLNSAIAVVSVLLVAGAVLATRRRSPLAVGLLAAAAGCWIVGSAIDADAMATGLLAGWPVVVLVAVRPWRDWSVFERDLAAVVVVGLVIVALTQYDEGGGLNWGGRFIVGALPVLALFVASALHARFTVNPGGRALALAALTLALVVTGASVRADSEIRRRHDRVADLAIEAQRSAVMVTSSVHLPRGSWRTVDEIDWILVAPESEGGIETTVALLRRAGIREFTAFRLDPEPYASLTGRDADDQPLVGELIELDP